MKIALLTTMGSRVSPVFETTQDWLNIKKTESAARIVTRHSFNNKTEIEMADELLSENIELIICGAIPYYLERILVKQGCEVISFISGEITEVIEALHLNILDTAKFKMPGCQKRKHRGKKHLFNHCGNR